MFCIGFFGPLKILPVISDPNKGTVAKNIGLVEGDKILQFNDRTIYNLVYKDVYNEFGTYSESALEWDYDMTFGTDMTNRLNNEEK